MKKTLTTVTVIAVIVLTVVGAYAQENNITGNWTMRFNDEISLRLVLTHEGKNVTGTLQDPHGNPIQIKASSPEKNFSLRVCRKVANGLTGCPKRVRYNRMGHFAGDIKSNVGDMTWTADRVEAK